MSISNLDINNRIDITSNDYNNEIKDLKIDLEKNNEQIRGLDINIKGLKNNYTTTTQEKMIIDSNLLNLEKRHNMYVNDSNNKMKTIENENFNLSKLKDDLIREIQE
jgi:predicted  nucleic acid-binding Zn-ribbon protein